MAATASTWTMGKGGAPALNMAAKPGDADSKSVDLDGTLNAVGALLRGIRFSRRQSAHMARL